MGILAISGLGLDIMRKTSGLQYYELLDADTPDNAYFAKCRAIIFPEASNGSSISFDNGSISFDDGTALDGLPPGAVWTGKILQDEHCHFMAVQVPFNAEQKDFWTKDVWDYVRTTPKTFVNLVNITTKEKMRMPVHCGGEKPGLWEVGDSQGVWAWPLLIGILLWMMLRLFQVILVETFTKKLDIIVGFEITLHRWWWIAQSGWSVILALILNFFIAPLSNMEAQSCPQIVTSYYSFRLQVVCSGIWFGIFFPLSCARLRKKMFRGKTNNADNETSPERNADNEPSSEYDPTDNEMSRRCLSGVGLFITTLIAMMLMPVVGSVCYYYKYYDYLLLVVQWDFKIYWPDFSFAGNSTLIRSLTLATLICDTLNFVLRLVKKAIVCANSKNKSHDDQNPHTGAPNDDEAAPDVENQHTGAPNDDEDAPTGASNDAAAHTGASPSV